MMRAGQFSGHVQVAQLAREIKPGSQSPADYP